VKQGLKKGSSDNNDLKRSVIPEIKKILVKKAKKKRII